MTQDQLLQAIKGGETIEFSQVMEVIADNFNYCPSQFSNGQGDQQLVNEAGQNEGSCKLFAFAQHHQLSEAETLSLFGSYYREDVLQHPNGNDHQNIRNFIRHGWSGIAFEKQPLEAK
ncbi:MAG: HopJ type III effector protein [Motiliproteus sp.]|nr:HopJ type III effector protein [Motiliproteus sp.]MCW9051768.1 HopJ type III effector protein [Motiliproteus sp.]